MTKAERSLMGAAVSVVRNGERSPSCVVMALRDAQRYSWLSPDALETIVEAIEGLGGEAASGDDGALLERLAELEEALELILSGVTDDEA